MDSEQAPEETTVRFLKILVTALTATMILGLLVIVGLFVMRFGQTTRVDLPAEVTLPGGATATAVTYGEGWYAVVTDAPEILIFDRVTGQLKQTVPILID